LKLDQIDYKIIEILSADGRIQNNKIAEMLDVSNGTIKNRINRLIESGLLNVKGLMNPNVFTEKQLIFLLVEVAINRDCEKAAEAINQLEGVKSVCVVTGKPDLIVEVFIETNKLIDFLRNDLGGLISTTAIDSMIVLKSYSKWV